MEEPQKETQVADNPTKETDPTVKDNLIVEKSDLVNLQQNEKNPTSVYFAFHGSCPDGFFCCILMDLLRYSCHVQKADFYLIMEQIFEEPYPEILTMNPEDPRTNHKFSPYVGALDKIPETSEYDQIKDVHYFPIIHLSTEVDVQRILKSPQRKDYCIQIDVGNIEVVKRLQPQFQKLYFVDHHLSALTNGLNDPEFVKKFKNVKYFYDTKHSACRLFYHMILSTGLLQKTFSPSFGANLCRVVNSVSIGDTNSAVNIPLADRKLKAGLCSLSEINSFTKVQNRISLRKIANYDFEVLEKLGNDLIATMDKEIAEEIQKAGWAELQYVSPAGKNIAIRFLCLLSDSKYRSEIANFLSERSYKEGLDPIALVYSKDLKRSNIFKGAWRSLDIANHPNTDVAEVAGLFKGGGHKHASGCEITELELKKMLRPGKIPKKIEEASEKLEACLTPVEVKDSPNEEATLVNTENKMDKSPEPIAQVSCEHCDHNPEPAQQDTQK